MCVFSPALNWAKLNELTYFGLKLHFALDSAHNSLALLEERVKCKMCYSEVPARCPSRGQSQFLINSVRDQLFVIFFLSHTKCLTLSCWHWHYFIYIYIHIYKCILYLYSMPGLSASNGKSIYSHRKIASSSPPLLLLLLLSGFRLWSTSSNECWFTVGTKNMCT